MANFRRHVRNILENGCTPGFRNNHPGGELYDIDNPEVRYDVHSRPPQERLSNLADNGPPNNVSILGRLLSEGSSLEGRQIAAAADDEVERQIQESLAAAGYLPGEDASDGDDDSIGRGGIMDDYYNDGSDSDDSRRHPLLAHPLDDDDNDIRQRQREEDIQATLDLVAQRQREEERRRDDDDNDNQGSSGGRRSKTKRNKQSKRKQSKRKQSKRKQSKRKYIKPNKRPILTNKNANKRRKQTRRR